jgi:hypothetical protein
MATTKRLMTKCRSCEVMIDQDEADKADRIMTGMGCETLCVACAERLAASSNQDDGEPFDAE